ncbi:(S)-N-methylcoclaurine 3'-hydroxylase isozyme 1 [Vitis vinifera]|uniref:(S)-N-methylcoclaurine 3'-hydroxylase isozyme 1 n=1 Tax=Vitis vinifera TaxID=29760 RepID=A0A438JJP3_VITVI|nr:(S)-N-methylcoclaurine 3'-hydroxylase isozyme 1 [Vitis vinifera]
MPHISLARFSQSYGPLISLRLGSQILVVASTSSAAMEILKTHDRVLSVECNGAWKNLRTVCRAELFSTKVMESQAWVGEKKVMEMRFYQLEDDNKDGGMKGFGLDLQGLNKKTKELIARICSMWESVIRERREGASDDPSKQDFLNILIRSGYSDDQINQLFMELLTAGADTSSSTLEWAMAELIKSPESMKKVHEELAREISDNLPKASDLPHLPYLQACVKETLRLHPSAPLLLPRRASVSCEVMNYTIPKDSQIWVNAWAIGRDPMNWEDPLVFKPERFLNSAVDFKGNNLEFIPFGAGRRICPGLPWLQGFFL